MLGLAVCSRYKPVLFVVGIFVSTKLVTVHIGLGDLYYLAVTIVLIIIADSRFVVNIFEKDSRGIDYPDDAVIGVTLDGKFTDITTRDNLNRLSQRTLTVNGNDLLSEEITYRESLQNCCVTSDMVSNVRTCVGETTTDTEYWYDEYGDIIGIEENGRFTSTYLYDK